MHHKLAFSLRDARTSDELASLARTVSETCYARAPQPSDLPAHALFSGADVCCACCISPRNLVPQAPPTPEEVNQALIEIKSGAYHVSSPNGAVYEVSDPTAGVAGGSDKARIAVRSQIASERSSFRQSWADFWYLLAGSFGLAALLILIRRASVNE